MENNSTKGGIGIGTLLCIIFIVLKLCHVIAWPWVWVLSPVWIPLALVFFIFICVYLYEVFRG